MKVFIADDHEILWERLTSIFTEIEDIEIVGRARNSIEAKDAISELKPDVVILDIRMPGGNGMDVIPNIKKDNPKCVVIMLTNYPYPQYRKRCMELGADFFFNKTTEFEKVSEVLKKLLSNSTQSGKTTIKEN